MSQNVVQDVYAKLNANQRKAIDALLTGASKDEAAAAADVTRRTVDRWHNEPDFSLALNQGGDQVIKDAAVRLKASLDLAIDVFRQMASGEEVKDAVRLRAADMLASHAIKVGEIADLVKRLEILEQRLNQ